MEKESETKSVPVKKCRKPAKVILTPDDLMRLFANLMIDRFLEDKQIKLKAGS